MAKTRTGKRLEGQIETMTDYQLANLAATLVYIALGPRALHALKAALALHNEDDRPRTGDQP